MLKKILLALILVVATTIAHADDDMKTAASKAYVDTSVETLQDKIPAANQAGVGLGETVMTYTAAGNGQIGERGIYTGANGYDASTDAEKLITASALNDTFTNLPTTGTTKLECANLNDGCTLWTIVDQTAYSIRLPLGYTQLEYIESTGTQYIDTGIVYARFVHDIQFTNQASTISLMGKNANQGMYWGQRRFGGTGYEGPGGYINVDPTARHIVEYGAFAEQRTYLKADGTTITGNNIANTLTYFLLGIRAASGSSTGYYCEAKLYDVKAYDVNDALIAHFIPAKDSNNIVGLYDTVSGQFFTNSGTGDFTPGPAVAN